MGSRGSEGRARRELSVSVVRRGVIAVGAWSGCESGGGLECDGVCVGDRARENGASDGGLGRSLVYGAAARDR